MTPPASWEMMYPAARPSFDLSPDQEADAPRDSRIHVRARDVTQGRHHDRQDDAVGQGDSEKPDGAVGQGVGDDGPGADEAQTERPDTLRQIGFGVFSHILFSSAIESPHRPNTPNPRHDWLGRHPAGAANQDPVLSE